MALATMSVADPHAAGVRPPERPDRRRLAFAIPAFVTALIAATPYVTFSFHRVPLNAMVPAHIVFLSLHGLASGTALLIGPLQFVRRIRTTHPQLHRTMGAVYLLAVLMGSVMALACAIVSVSGGAPRSGSLSSTHSGSIPASRPSARLRTAISLGTASG